MRSPVTWEGEVDAERDGKETAGHRHPEVESAGRMGKSILDLINECDV